MWSFCAEFWWLAYRWQKSPPVMSYMPERKDLFWKTAREELEAAGLSWPADEYSLLHGRFCWDSHGQKIKKLLVVVFLPLASLSVVCSSTGTERGVLAWKDAASSEDNDGYRGACWCRFIFFFEQHHWGSYHFPRSQSALSSPPHALLCLGVGSCFISGAF